MDDYLPNITEAARFRARKLSVGNSNKIALHIEDMIIPISEFYETGFSIHKKYRLPKRANVEIFDGSKPIFAGLIQHANGDQDQQHYEFKRVAPVVSQAPIDYDARENYGDDDVYLAGLITQR